MERTDPAPISGDERLKDLLDELIDCPPSVREARLAELAGEDPQRAAELAALLEADAAADDGFLAPLAPAAEDELGPIPEFVGPYRIEGVLGRGGMACVFRGVQTQPIEREVAIKVLRPGVASPQILKRFDAERHVLARLEHPGIARVLDAGAEPYGPAYFVMELVDGPPLTDYAIEQQLPLSRRIELVIEACRAVQHAHGRGILHRDLKPSNILVATTDNGPQPKVIDFGVAKALERDRLIETELTQAGQLIGTLEYMSPEQAGFGGHEVDVRTDVFSMGVVLYELIADRRPLDLEGQNVSGLSKFLRALETQEPMAPSARDRCDLPVDLSRSAVADLDCVVRRALEREPQRRYATMYDLAEDLRRVLEGAPVEARPPTRTYLLARYARRNRLLTAATLGLLLSLVAGVVGTSLGLARAVDQEQQLEDALDRARSSLAESEQVTDFLSSLMLDARTAGLGPQTPVLEVVRAAGVSLLDGTGRPLSSAVRGRLAASIGATLFAENDTLAATPLLDLAIESLRGVEPTNARLTALTESLQRRGVIALDLGDQHAAEQHFRTALDLLLENDGYLDRQDEFIVQVEEDLAVVVAERGDSMAAIPLQRQALERLIAMGGKPIRVAALQTSLAITLVSAGAFDEAAELAEQSLAIRREEYPPADFRTLNTLRVLAACRSHQGRAAEGLELLDAGARAADLEPGDHRGLALAIDLASARYRADPSAAHGDAVLAAIDAALPRLEEQPRGRAAVALKSVRVLAERDLGAALARIDEALGELDAALEPNDRYNRWQARLTAGRALHDAARHAAAGLFLEDALAGMLATNSSRPPLADIVESWLARAGQ